MFRVVFGGGWLFGVVTAVAAQPLTPLTTASGVGGFGGGLRPGTPALVAPTAGPWWGAGFGWGGGLISPYPHRLGVPFSGIWWGGYGFGNPYALLPVVPVVPVVPVPVPVPQSPRRPEPPPLIPGNEFPAVLVLELPAPGEIWVNGRQAEGGPATEWVLTSPVLRAGGEYTFDVKARWTAGGKSYESQRAVTVVGGRRSRLLVLAGTEVRE